MVAISIVIPVYNIEKYLEKCLDSLINQTFKDFEIICVNDGSKDSSLEILNEYAKKDSRFKIITQENGGSGSARNNGLSHAQGKYVQFLDGDDYFESEMLEKLYNLAETHKADVAVCSSRKVDDDGNITETRNPNSPLNLSKIILNKPFNYKDFPDDIFSLTGTAPWNKLYLRELLIKNNLTFPKLTGPDDLCFVHMAIVCAEKIVAIDDEFINYRYNRVGSVQSYRANHTIDIIKAFLYIKGFLEKRGIYEVLEKAYKKASLFSVRWEISLCNDEQYEVFLNQLREEFPNDWKMFAMALRSDFVTLDYLYRFIGDKKVYLWGASNFLKNLLEKETKPNPNILGIIDRNEASWGKYFGNYKVYSPKILENVDNVGILVTIYNNHERAHKAIKDEIENFKPFIEVLDNIFVMPTDLKNNILLETQLCNWFYRATGEFLDLSNPKSFNEKIQWLKLYDSTPIKTWLADKYLVRDWIKEKIGEEYLIPLLGVWDSFDEIDFNQLPDKFALKPNHGSYWKVICTDKNSLNFDELKQNFDKWMKTNFAFCNGYEMQYEKIPPKIICEKYLDSSGQYLPDYRFFVFNGKVKYVQVDDGGVNNPHKRSFYTPDLIMQPFSYNTRDWPMHEEPVEKPKNYDKMFELAEYLGRDFIFVRVDFYNIEGKIYFGEMTFTPASGVMKWFQKEANLMMGNLIELNQIT